MTSSSNSSSREKDGWLECDLLIEGVGLSIVEDVEDGGECLLRGRADLSTGCKERRVLARLVSFRRTFDIVFTRA